MGTWDWASGIHTTTTQSCFLPTSLYLSQLLQSPTLLHGPGHMISCLKEALALFPMPKVGVKMCGLIGVWPAHRAQLQGTGPS